MAKSVSHDRRTVFYPDPIYKKRLEVMNKVTGESQSSIINKAVREFLDKKDNTNQQSL